MSERVMNGPAYIVGIDPGLNLTGYGVIDVSGRAPAVREAGIIRGGSASLPLTTRLAAIYDGVRDLLNTFCPAVLSLEQLYSHYERPRTAILMGHARGVIALAAQRVRVEVHSYAATQVKKLLTGSGRAPKDQMQRAIQLELGLKTLPEPPDVADALAIALCHYYSTRATAVPTERRRA